MNREKYTEEIQDYFDGNVDIVRTKSQDYATEEHVFHNIESVAAICQLTVEQVILVFKATKIARQANLLAQEREGRKPNHESIEDSGRDECNYEAIMKVYRDTVAKERSIKRGG